MNLTRIGKDWATKSLSPGIKVYDEFAVKRKDGEYRIIDSKKSKYGAALAKGMKKPYFAEHQKVLYLGIASGTTASHIADIVGMEGIIYGVEFAARPLRDLVRVSEKRKNIIPIMADARIPSQYANRIEKVDVIYQDVAQRDQSEILIRNADIFLRKGGLALIAIKAQSIDVTKQPKVVFVEQQHKLENKFEILEKIDLHPYEKGHMMFVLRKK